MPSFAAETDTGKETGSGANTICIEAESGRVLAEENADVQRPPASMVKMMLMLLVAEGIEKNAWTLDTEITVSAHAQSMGGSQLWLKEGDTYPLSKLMGAVAVASANDAAMAVAEGLWGSKEAYLERANARAAELGMTRTELHSVHGLPARNGDKSDLSTARDMAALGRACARHTLVLEWTGQKEFLFRTDGAAEYSTNKLLWRMDECDGLKTGWTRAAGFCVTATACRDGMRVIAVVMGHPNNKARFDLAKSMLEEGFDQAAKLLAATQEPGDPVAAPASALDPLKRQHMSSGAGDDTHP